MLEKCKVPNVLEQMACIDDHTAHPVAAQKFDGPKKIEQRKMTSNPYLALDTKTTTERRLFPPSLNFDMTRSVGPHYVFVSMFVYLLKLVLP